MSSLRAAGADGFYIDPNQLDPRRGRGSANAIAGSHPLGVRAKRLRSDGILTIRFEMPYDSTCLGCGCQVKHGVRFNAAKSRAGEYLTTPIWDFRMRCVSHSGCRTEFLIRTDPAKGSYEFVSGIVRRTSGFIPEAEDGLGRAGGSLFETTVAAARVVSSGSDGIAKLQMKRDDASRAAAAEARFEALKQDATRRYADRLGGAHGAAMKVWRSGAAASEEADAMGAARGLFVPLAPPLMGDEEIEARDAYRTSRLAATATLLLPSLPPQEQLDGLFFPPPRIQVHSTSSKLTTTAKRRAPPPPPPLAPPLVPPTSKKPLLLPGAGVADIIAAGLAVRAAERARVATAPWADASVIAARLRASSGMASHNNQGPRVTLRVGPAPPPTTTTILSSLAPGRFVGR